MSDTLRILAALADYRRRLTAAELAAAAAIGPRALRNRLAAMRQRGLVAKGYSGGKWRSMPAGRAVLAAALRADAGAAPSDSLRQRLWTALRRLRKATVAELVTLAADGGERDARQTGQTYLRALSRAGYVVAVPRRRRTDPYRWVLVRDSGPKAPAAYRGAAGAVIDLNTGQEVRRAG